MADKNINKMLEDLSRQLGVSEDKIKSSAQSGNVQDILKNADKNQAKKIEDILSDPEKTREILNSHQAQALLKMFGNDADK